MKLVAFVACALTSGCGIYVRRDLTPHSTSQIVYEDLCQLQAYFDTVETGLAPPTEVFNQDIFKTDRTRPVGGRVRFRFSTSFQMRSLRHVLETNWRGVPSYLDRAHAIEIEARWAEKAGVRRLFTNEPTVLSADGRSWFLPYHPCLSDFLFGASLYDSRRAMLHMAKPEVAPIN